jgi:hypothetical protein
MTTEDRHRLRDEICNESRCYPDKYARYISERAVALANEADALAAERDQLRREVERLLPALAKNLADLLIRSTTEPSA